MPELPEVTTTVLGLQKVITGKSFTAIWSDMWSSSPLYINTIKNHAYFEDFKQKVLFNKVLAVKRRAKYILIHLENEYTVIVHLKMTGHLMYGDYKQNMNYNGKEWSWVPKSNNKALLDPYNRHIHVVLSLSDGKQLVFCDSRKFGSISLEKTSDLDQILFSKLGPEPLEREFSVEKLQGVIQKSPKKPIKTTLMDQSVISGIGNIYSDEMLHNSSINPKRTTKSLTKQEISKLFTEMQKVLRGGIDFGGDSMSDYRNIDGERGKFQEKHLVYLRTKLPCKRKGCTGIITKEKLGGRSTHYCPVCQK